MDELATPECRAAAARGETPQLSSLIRARYRELFGRSHDDPRHDQPCEVALSHFTARALCRLNAPDSIAEMGSVLTEMAPRRLCFEALGERAAAGDVQARVPFDAFVDAMTDEEVSDSLLLEVSDKQSSPLWRPHFARALRRATTRHVRHRDRLYLALCSTTIAPASNDALDKACRDTSAESEALWHAREVHFHDHVKPHLLTATLVLASVVVAGAMAAASFGLENSHNEGSIPFGAFEGATAGSLLGLAVGLAVTQDYWEAHISGTIGVLLGAVVGGLVEGLGWGPEGTQRLGFGLAAAGVTLVSGAIVTLFEIYVFHFGK